MDKHCQKLPHSKCGNDCISDSRRLFLKKSLSLIGIISFIGLFSPFFASLFPGKKARKAQGPIRVDLKSLKPGDRITVIWKGKPIWVIRRTKEMLRALAADEKRLVDPDSLVPQQPLSVKNRDRSLHPEYFVVVALCTHLGCIPTYEKEARDLVCPCHGSRFDWAGRVLKGSPAPINLEIPPYQFIGSEMIEIGVKE